MTEPLLMSQVQVLPVTALGCLLSVYGPRVMYGCAAPTAAVLACNNHRRENRHFIVTDGRSDTGYRKKAPVPCRENSEINNGRRGGDVSETKMPDAERTKKRILADYQHGKKPKELSETYGVNINTIKSWIRRVQDAPTQKGASKKGAKKAPKNAPKKKPGAPLGNSNAVGAGAPKGNHNAMKHGGYSPAFWDTLTEEEQAMIAGVEYDGEQLLLDEIALLTVREHRIMASIKKHSEARGGQAVAGVVRSEEKREFASDEDRELYEERQQEKIENGDLLPGHPYHITTRTEATYDIVHRLEEALTRCQAQKQRLIQSLNELRIARGDEGKREPENNLLEALLASTSGEISTDDIPELFEAPEHSDDVVE